VAEKVGCSCLQAPMSAEVRAVKWIVPITQAIVHLLRGATGYFYMADGQGKCYV